MLALEFGRMVLALALVLGIVIAYLLDRRDRRIRSFKEIEAVFEAPVLATVPIFVPWTAGAVDM